ncbi:MAG: MBL fold metallo-hydrolase [Sandaracinaceae bacterium]|nr:MBL fold metallo-hydrolase [Sandaracinaceae bacterium]
MRLTPVLVDLLVTVSLSVLVACGNATPPLEEPGPTARERVVLGPGAGLTPIADGAWVFTTEGPDGSANALLVETEAGSVLVDTGWSASAVEALVDWARGRGRPLTRALITSADADRSGGARALVEAGVHVFASTATRDQLAAQGDPLAAEPLEDDSIPEVRWMFVRIAPDPEALVAYHAPSRTLFGGRFIDERAAERPSRRGDHDRNGWRAALDLVAESFPDALHVVPGRGASGGLALVAHTRSLLAECDRDADCQVVVESLDACSCCGCAEPRAMTPAAVERAREGQPSCLPMCDDVSACPPCPTPEERAQLHAVCDRGECTLR